MDHDFEDIALLLCSTAWLDVHNMNKLSNTGTPPTTDFGVLLMNSDRTWILLFLREEDFWTIYTLDKSFDKMGEIIRLDKV